MSQEGSVVPRERVNIVCSRGAGGSGSEVELPLRILMIGDYIVRGDERVLGERAPVNVNKDNFNEVLARHDLALDLEVADRLSQGQHAITSVHLNFKSLKDFSPGGVASQVPEMRALLELRSALTAIKGPLGPTPMFRKAIQPLLADEAGRQTLKRELGLDGPTPPPDESLLVRLLGDFHITPRVEGYDVCKRGFEAVVAAMLTPKFAGERLDKNVADTLIADVDLRLSAQANELLHHPAFQRLESTWRTLKYVVDQVDFRENITLEILNCSMEDLCEDFEDSPDLCTSGLYKILDAGRRSPDGGPLGLVVLDHDFGPGVRDVGLLTRCAAVAARVQAPFLAAASPQMFGAASWMTPPRDLALENLFEGPDYTRWRAFRAHDNARYVGLCLPRFLLRLPYGDCTVPVKAFNFEEDVAGRDEHLLWGSAAAALATRVADSFARYRWCPNIVGPSDGALRDLPAYQYEIEGEVVTRDPTEVQLSGRRLRELSEAGFIGLTHRRDDATTFFASASSCRSQRAFSASDDVRSAAIDHYLEASLPYVFVVTRLAHYLTVVHCDEREAWSGREEIERGLDAWIQQYVADLDDPTPAIRSRRPLRTASVVVEERSMELDTYPLHLRVQPHFRYMGAPFSLSLVGGLDV